MFLPFLPYLIVMSVVAARLELNGVSFLPLPGPGFMGTASTLALFAIGPLLGALAGHLLTRRAPGLPGRLSVQKQALVVGTWLVLLWITPMPEVLEAAIPWPDLAQPGALMLLILNFWLTDALSVRPFSPWRRQATLREWAGLWESLRLPLPLLLVLLLAGLILPGLMEWSGLTRRLPPLLEPMISLSLMLILGALVVPPLIRICWGLRPLRSTAATAVVQEELAANGVTVGAVLAWPEGSTGVATAGVIGLLSPFRYLLFSNTLAESLTPAELRSVTAHEAAHLKHRHLWYLLGAIFGFLLLVQMALVFTALLGGAPLPVWGQVFVEITLLLVFLRFGMGFVSRVFERQADTNALRRQGLGAFYQALTKVGQINHIPLDRDNWHHYGIQQRISFLSQSQNRPELLIHHDRRATWVKGGLALLLVLGLSAQAVLQSTELPSWLLENALSQRAEGLTQPAPSDLPLLHFLASRALERERTQDAERYLRLILQVTPSDAPTLNNLAWVLVTRPQAPEGLLQEGLALAREATLLSDSAYIWDTLAEAHHRLNQHPQAAQAAVRALRLARDGVNSGEAPLEYYQRRAEELAHPKQGI